MKTHLLNSLLVLVIGLSIILAGCSPAAAAMGYSAQDLALTTDDLGDGWVLDAEKTDLNPGYYFDRGADGKAIIGIHKNTNVPLFDLATVETMSMRGFSQPEKKLVLLHFVTVFKDLSSAEEIAKELLPDAGRDRDIPEENYSYQEVSIGDEAILVGVREPQDAPPFATFLYFRKGRVLAALLSMGDGEDPANAPVVDEAQLEELAKIVAARIP
jgi:hypothetical protein